jgi:predicted nucleotidyltransferase
MKIKSIKERIKDHFLANPTQKLRVRQIEREVEVPLPSAIRYAKELEKEGILKTVSIAGVTAYTANRSSKALLLEKLTYNLRTLHETGLVEHIIKEHSNPPIIVFGSYSRGEDTEDSDIDIYIETSKKTDIDLTAFENRLKRKIQVFQHRKITDIKNRNLANNIINGIVLNGQVEVLK